MFKVKTIIPGVYQVGGPDISDYNDCLIYLIESDGELAIIDAGVGRNPEQIISNIKELGFHPDQVAWIIATHGHIDHIGGLSFLKAQTGAKVAAHRLDLPAIAEGDPRRTAAHYYGISYQPVQVDKVIEGEEQLTLGSLTLRLIPTPGHTPGSMVVFTQIDGSKVLFGQDMHGPFDSDWGSDRQVWRDSMQKLRELNADILGEGHFGIYRPAEKVKEYIGRLLGE